MPPGYGWIFPFRKRRGVNIGVGALATAGASRRRRAEALMKHYTESQARAWGFEGNCGGRLGATADGRRAVSAWPARTGC